MRDGVLILNEKRARWISRMQLVRGHPGGDIRCERNMKRYIVSVTEKKLEESGERWKEMWRKSEGISRKVYTVGKTRIGTASRGVTGIWWGVLDVAKFRTE